MKNMRKALSLLLTLTVILSGMTGLFITVSAAEIEIDSAAGFKSLITGTDTYKIIADIDFKTANVTDYQIASFAGNMVGVPGDYDGTGVIRNPIITLNGTALVDKMTGGSFENLTTAGEVTASGTLGTGTFANSNEGYNRANTITFRNCVNTADIRYAAGKNYIGGLIGYAHIKNTDLLTIENCHNKAAITGNYGGTAYVGGLVGMAAGVKITNSSNQGNVTGMKECTGGLVGEAYSGTKVTISKSFNSGAVTTGNTDQTNYIGGLVGRVNTETEISDSFNSGAVNAVVKYTGYAGGIVGCVGAALTLNNCYNYSTLAAKTAALNIVGLVKSGSPTITNCYYRKDNAGTGNEIDAVNIKALTHTQMKSLSNFEGFSDTVWTATAENYPYPTLLGLDYPQPATAVTGQEAGATADDPIEISNQEQFEAMASATGYKYYVLTDDINLVDYTPFAFYGNLTSANPAEPRTITMNINLPTQEDVGLFTTNGSNQQVVISNIILDGTVTGKTNTGALFGKIAAIGVNSSVTNVVNKANVTGTTYTGGIFGQQYGGGNLTVSNLRNEGTVNGSNQFAGGIVGVTNKNCSYKNCSNYGSVSGRSAAGIAAYTFNGVMIENCFNAGRVYGTYDSGGISCVSTAADTVKNCYNAGYSYYAGISGIRADSAATIENCYNIGTLESTSGKPIGGSYHAIRNSYYLSLDSADDDSVDGTTPKTREELKTLAATLGSAYKTGDKFPILTANEQTDMKDAWVITITAGENGKASIGSTYRLDGETIKWQAWPEKDYVVDTVKIDGVPTESNQDGYYSTIVTKDITISLTFKEPDPIAPTIGENEGKQYVFKETGGASITFGVVGSGFKAEILGYGIVYSKTNSEPTIGGTACVECAADTVNKPMSANGHFGIHLIFHPVLNSGDTYYTRTYVAYRLNDGAVQYAYGTTATITAE